MTSLRKNIDVLGQSVSVEAVVLVLAIAVLLGYVVRKLTIFLLFNSFVTIIFAIGCVSTILFYNPKRSRKKSFKDVLKPLKITIPDEKQIEPDSSLATAKLPVFPQSFLVSKAVDQLIEYVIRDFVLSWFQNISNNSLFPDCVDMTIRLALTRLIGKLGKVEWSDFLVTRLIPIISDHFKNFVSAETAVRERSMGRELTDPKEFQLAVASQYCHGRLHPAVSKYSDSSRNWLRDMVSKKLVPFCIDSESKTVTHLVRDIVACSLLLPVINMVSEPDYWNNLVVNSFGQTLQDRQKVEKLMKALNEHAAVNIKLGPTADQAAYDKFLKSIYKTQSIAEARQIRYYISVQLQRSSKNRNLKSKVEYIKRLNIAKAATEKQIAKLSGKKLEPASSSPSVDTRENYTLKDILGDPACAVYFMEFMDQSRRTMLVQFWLTVNSLRDPLQQDEALSLNENDIRQIYSTYFSGKMSYVTADAQEAVAKYLSTGKGYDEAKSAILDTQIAVYKAMESKDLVKFKRSDLFLKFLALNRTFQRKTEKSDVDELQLDTIEYKEPSAAIEAAFNNIMESSVNRSLVDDKKAMQDKLFGSESESSSEEEQEEPAPALSDTDELHLAAPGDLSLTEAISILTSEIEVLYRQEAVLEPLLRKAELTNNVGNLRILRKSKTSLEREIQRKELQRQQYIVQESDNSLYNRSNIQIRSYMSSSDSGGHYMLYVIEVERLASDGTVSAGWVVARRYNQFFQLHQHLRSTFPQVRKLDFPKKGVVLKFQHKSFVDARKVALQKYLRELLKMPEVCRSKAFRLFLSSETFSVDSLSNGTNTSSTNTSSATGSADEGDEEIDMSQSFTIDAEELDSARPFIQPICDLFIQLFGFDRGNNWLRGRAVVLVVQQLLGGTVEKKIREYVSNFTNEQTLSGVIEKVTGSVWPNGTKKPPSIPRTKVEKLKCKHDAEVILHALIRDASIKIVGSSSSRYASTHVFGMFQNEILNAHLVYTLLDVFVEQVIDQ